jgi:hypothetical protein
MSPTSTPLVVQYLYVHEREEGFFYPTARAQSSAAEVAMRYLECALTQAASLALRDTPCELMLATNVREKDRYSALGKRGCELVSGIEALGVHVIATEYLHRPKPGTEIYVSSRYVLDAMLSASEGQPEDRQLWLTDLDCVWNEPKRVFAATPPPSEIGCIYIGYQPDWDTVGFEVYGRSRRAIGELAVEMGASECDAPPWVGGELLTGRPAALRELVSVCERLDSRLEEEGKTLPNEEQILSLAGALGEARFHDLSGVAGRIATGPRNLAAKIQDPFELGLWHLPAEKGLSLRRTAQQVRRGRTAPLRRDLSDPHRTARRFNVAGVGSLRHLRDDGWIAGQRVRSKLRSTFGRD